MSRNENLTNTVKSYEIVRKQLDYNSIFSKKLSLVEIEQNIDLIESNIHEITISNVPKIPIMPTFTKDTDFYAKLQSIQDFIQSFEYNFTNFQLSTYTKKKTFASMIDYAKILIKKALPIRCLDGFILGAYLTYDMQHCIRFPLRFMSHFSPSMNNNGMSAESAILDLKSKSNITQNYWHILLGIYHKKHHTFGTIGISRKTQLAYKLCEHKSLLALIQHFMDCYHECHHNVQLLTIGLPLTNDIYCEDPIFWDIFQMQIDDHFSEEYFEELNEIFCCFFQFSTQIFHSLSMNCKPFLFHPQIMIDNKQKYKWKKQIQK